MRSIVPLATLCCLLAACSDQLDAGSNNADARINSTGEGGTSNQGGGGDGGAGASGASDQAGQAGTAEPGGGAGQAGTAGGGGTGDAGAAGSSGTGSSRKKGLLSFGHAGKSDGQYGNWATAYFHDIFDPNTPLSYCTVVPHGSCQYATCGTPVEDAPPTLDAGTITFAGGTVSPVQLFRSGDFYSQTTPTLPTNAPTVLGGEQIVVTAAGGDVPAFSLAGLVPASLQIAGLPFQNQVNTDIDTTQDISLTLSGSTEGEVGFVWYAADFASGTVSYLSCDIPASQTSVTIPASGLAKLKEFSTQGMYRVLFRKTTSAAVGDWDIKLSLFNAVNNQDGTPHPDKVVVTYK